MSKIEGEEEVDKKSTDKIEPFLKTSTPIRPLKNFISTVSYLRPAIDNKQIAPVK